MADKLRDGDWSNGSIIVALSGGAVLVAREISNSLNIPLVLFSIPKNFSVPIKGKTVIVVDDGVVTGKTMAEVLRSVWQQEPKRVIAATPVISPQALPRIEEEADEVCFLECPQVFISLANYYQNFPKVSDDEVKKIFNNQRIK